MLKSTLSVCLITKNEEKVIKRCLESIKDIAEEIIVVDTGSSDATITIAGEFGAQVIPSVWCDDFSYSRNLALDQAKGDWILVLDADEELCREDREILLKALEKPLEGYNLSLINYIDSNHCNYVTDYVCRLFRNNQSYRFQKRIHEEIYSSIVNSKGPQAVGNLKVKIYHYGYIEDSVKQKEKNSRNLKLLELQLVECSEEDKPYYLYALGVEYFQKEQFAQGAQLLTLALESTPQKMPGFRSDCYLKLILCQINAGHNNLVEKTFAKALEEYPDFVDLLFLQGQVLYNQQRFEDAITYFTKCLNMPLSSKYTSIAGVNSFRSWYYKGLCFSHLENFNQSEQCFARSLEIEPNFFPAWQSWQEIKWLQLPPVEKEIIQIDTWIYRSGIKL